MLETFAYFILDSALTQWIQSRTWLWPAMEISHFMGLALLFGGLIIVDLRMAGYFKALSPAVTHKLLPIVLLGFGINLITGVMFFYGDPLRYSVNIGFQIKMVLIGLAGINALFYHFKISPLMKSWDAATASPLIAKCVAYTSLSLWTGVLLLGRWIPYVGTG